MVPSFTIPLEKIHKITIYSPELIDGGEWPRIKIRYGRTTEIAGNSYHIQDLFNCIIEARARVNNRYNRDH